MTKKKNKISKEESAAYALVGRIGGKANARKGKKYMSDLGKRGAEKRWKNKKPIIIKVDN